MNVVRLNFVTRMQCCFLVALILFSTLGCSAKQSLFEAFEIATELPLNGSKAACSTETTSRLLTYSSSSAIKTTFILPTSVTKTVVLATIPLKKELNEDYILSVTDTSPPLYLKFKKLKLALI